MQIQIWNTLLNKIKSVVSIRRTKIRSAGRKRKENLLVERACKKIVKIFPKSFSHTNLMCTSSVLFDRRNKVVRFFRKPRYTHYCSIWNILLGTLYQKCNIWTYQIYPYKRKLKIVIFLGRKLCAKESLKRIYCIIKRAALQHLSTAGLFFFAVCGLEIFTIEYW